MTVNYSLQVSNTGLGTFLRLWARWKGSVAKALYQETILYFSLYALISFLYRSMLDDSQKRRFERVAQHCETSLNYIPITFVLGFYISIVFARWMNIQNAIAWPDKVALSLMTFMDGEDPRSKAYRSSIVRYVMTAEVLVLRDVSAPVKKRFPTLNHIVESGFLTIEELEEFERVRTKNAKYWIPIAWALTLVRQAAKRNLIDTPYITIGHIVDFRGKLGLLLDYDWVSIPLVYTQVVSMAVAAYFGTCLVARQFLDPQQGIPGHGFDMYFPVFTFLQFIFYMGWLKVAECMINPLGEDDDDLELNYIIDRNVEVSFLQVEELCGKAPPLKYDRGSCLDTSNIPYTAASRGQKNDPLVPSAANITVKENGQKKAQ